MQVPDTVPRSPGVFALLHAASGMAYVNQTTNLRQRALLWQVRLDDYANPSPALPTPAKDFPKHPADQWSWWQSPLEGDEALEQSRAMLETAGWKVFNAFKPRKEYVVAYAGGEVVTASLAKHCKVTGAKLHTVYKRLDKGMTVEQALGLTEFPPLDKRELAISQMRVQIETESGGLLTYDEALMVRPELGDVRDKIKRLRKKNPAMTKIKLAEIPA